MEPAKLLSKREQVVVGLLLQGKSNKLIALSLGISSRTVEFHLKNVYAKYQVNSKIELILRLVNATGNAMDENLGGSAVVRQREITENRERHNAATDKAKSIRAILFQFGKEPDMRNLFETRHVFVVLAAALAAGVLWVVLLIFSGNIPALYEARIPMLAVLPVIGFAVGLAGKQSGNTLRKVFYSTLCGIALSPFTVLPLMMTIVLPLGKLAALAGLIDPARITSEAARMTATLIMTAVCLFVGTAMGIAALYLKIQKPERMDRQPA